MSSFKRPPQHTQVLIIGGGPAGSYAASALAREGLDVTLLEADKFPRYHVGESLIPSVRQYLRYIGAESALVDHGFVFKPGSAIKFNQFKREGYTDFVALGYDNNAWNVVRSEFDQLLMNHARASGAAVYELTKVTDVSFSSTDPTKPVSVTWSHTPTPSVPSSAASPWAFVTSFLGKIVSPLMPKSAVVTGTTTFTHLIDATGRAGLLSTKYLKSRHYNASLKNVAVWAYWKGTALYGAGTAREGAPWFEALTDESGWAWFIPLHNGTTSIGIVVNQKVFASTLEQPLAPSPFSHPSTFNPTNSKMIAYYLSTLALAPGVVRLITSRGSMVEGSVKSASDFSYSAASYAGSNYRIVGDAGAFIDPFFSSGIHLALTSALSASATICASIRGHCTESSAAEWHTRRVSTSYTRFQVVVLSAYKQIRAQNMDILSDIDEDNYDRAFAFLRPVIQGASDMGKRLSETELQKSLDFCVNLFNPTSPEEHERLSQSTGLGNKLFDITAPLVDPMILQGTLQIGIQSLGSCSEIDSDSDTDGDQSSSESDRVIETRMILEKINARRVIHAEYHLNNMEVEPIGGYVMHLERGVLGLAKTTHKTYCIPARIHRRALMITGGAGPNGPVRTWLEPQRAPLVLITLMTTDQERTFTLNNGLSIPAVGLGCWMGEVGGGNRVYDMCMKALQNGYRHFDTASTYGNEERVGAAIRSSGIPREEIFVTTKLPDDWKDVHQSFDASLKELGLDYVDLYLIHWPQHIVRNDDGSQRVLKPGDQLDFVHAWKEMEKLLETGKVKSIGVSNFSIKTLNELLPHCTIIPVTNQVELHPCLPQIELKQFCEERGILLTAYSPLGRSTTFFTEPIVKAIANRMYATPAQVILNWAVQRGTVVIPKSEDEGRMIENLKMLSLSEDDMKAIEEIHTHRGMHKSLLKYHAPDGTVFGWSYDWLGWNMKTGGIIA